MKPEEDKQKEIRERERGKKMGPVKPATQMSATAPKSNVFPPLSRLPFFHSS